MPIKTPFRMEGDRFVTVAGKQMGVRAYLKHEVGFPASTLAAIPDSDILLGGAPLPHRYRLSLGDEISVFLGDAPSPPPAVFPHATVLWEDGHLLAVAKPHGDISCCQTGSSVPIPAEVHHDRSCRSYYVHCCSS